MIPYILNGFDKMENEMLMYFEKKGFSSRVFILTFNLLLENAFQFQIQYKVLL